MSAPKHVASNTLAGRRLTAAKGTGGRMVQTVVALLTPEQVKRRREREEWNKRVVAKKKGIENV